MSNFSFYNANGLGSSFHGRGRLSHGRSGPFGGLGQSALPWSLIIPFSDAGAGVANLQPTLGSATPTFSRATSAWTMLSNGTIGLVASGSARSYYTPGGVYAGYCFEPASTNLVKSSQDLSAADWTNIGATTPTLASATTTRGALVLDTLGDDDAAVAAEGKFQLVAFTGNSSKGISFYVKQGTSTSFAIRLRDTTALANRLLAAGTFSGGAPVIAMTTGVDLTGTPEQLGTSGVYRIELRAQGVVAANVNQIEIYPATNAALAVAGTGTIEIGGLQAENQISPSTYMPTGLATTTTRNEDKLSHNYAPLEPASIYAEVYNLAQNLDSTAKHYVLIARTDESFGYGLIRGETVNPPVLLASVKISGANDASAQVGQFSVRTSAKIAGVFGLNYVNSFKGGVAGTLDIASAEPTGMNEMMIGCSTNSGAQNASGCIMNVKVAQVLFSDATLNNLTT